MGEGATEDANLVGDGSTFDQAIAYIRPHKDTAGRASISLRAGMLRCCVSAILMRVADLERERDEAREAKPIVPKPGPDARCPFNDPDGPDLPADFSDDDPCPVCGDLSLHDNGGNPIRCIYQG